MKKLSVIGCSGTWRILLLQPFSFFAGIAQALKYPLGVMNEQWRCRVKCFADEYREVTGVNLDADKLFIDFKLSQA